MTRTSLDDAQWVSLMLVLRQIPLAWKRDEAALRRCVEAALWMCRTGAPWRDLPETLGCWSSVYHRWHRGCLRGWWEPIIEALRPALPADGLLLLDTTTCKAHRAVLRALPEPPDFVAVLDADFVPHRDFLDRTLALFKDPKVGLVQTP
jgi:transposase